MDVDAPGALFVQIADSARAAIHEQFPERSHARCTPSRTMRHHQMRELQEFPPLMPLRQAQESVHPDDEAKAAVRILVPQFPQSLDRIRRPLLAHFTIVDYEAGLIGGCELHHAETQLRIGQGLIAVRRIARGQEANFLEAQRLLQLEGGAQVRVVDRIERAAEYSHRVHTATLPESRVACKAPAMPMVRETIEDHGSPGTMPLMVRSTRAASRSNAASCILSTRLSARGVGFSV